MKCRNPRSHLALLAVTYVMASAMPACSGSSTGGSGGSKSQGGASGSGGQTGNGGINAGGGGKTGSGGAIANSGGVGSGGQTAGTSSPGSAGRGGATSNDGGQPGSGGQTVGGAAAVGGSGLGGGTGTAGNAGAGGFEWRPGRNQGCRRRRQRRRGIDQYSTREDSRRRSHRYPLEARPKSPILRASGGSSVGLAGTGQGAGATGLPAASKLAIHYASVSVGTISVSVNSQTAVKVNVHSSGALTGSFLYAIISIAIPANASVTVSHASGDVAVNIDKLIVGDGDLGLPPDIWNLPTFQPATGAYAADWTKLGLTYSAPEWWRDAKFGAWAHWDPQSMPEQGDWYAHQMYQQGSADFNYQVAHFGDPGGTNPYGYKDICKNWVIDQWIPKSLMDLYVQMGAKYFMAMGTHHDNFACYDSIYQQWNAAKVGVKQDIVATWEPLARQAGLRLASVFTIRRHAPGVSGCRCATPATRKDLTMR